MRVCGVSDCAGRSTTLQIPGTANTLQLNLTMGEDALVINIHPIQNSGARIGRVLDQKKEGCDK